MYAQYSTINYFCDWAEDFKQVHGLNSLHEIRKRLNSAGLSTSGGFVECAARYYYEVHLISL